MSHATVVIWLMDVLGNPCLVTGIFIVDWAVNDNLLKL
jgi:hypothetical protein